MSSLRVSFPVSGYSTDANSATPVTGVDVIFGMYLGPGDTMLTYLPLAHILEFVFENLILWWGATMGYGSPKTLSDSSVRNCAGDIREFKPTILVGVPAVWETVKKGIITKVNQGSPFVKNLFWGAMAAKSFLLWAGLPGSVVLDAIVFKKLKEATGGRLRVCMNGGGPIAKETQRFISMAIAPLVNGYGLTETAAYVHLTAQGCVSSANTSSAAWAPSWIPWSGMMIHSVAFWEASR